MPRPERRAEINEFAKRIHTGAKKGGAPALSELAEISMREFGGATEFIRQIKAEIELAPEGSIARQRLYGCLMELTKAAAKQHQERRVDDELLTEDDLKREFFELMGTVAEDDTPAEKEAKNDSGGRTESPRAQDEIAE